MKIKINKFKQLNDIVMDVGEVTLLIGSNNAGKSSILQAIQFGVSVAQATSLLPNARWKHNKLPTSIGQAELMYLPIKDVSYLAQKGQLKEERDKAISIEYIKEDAHTKVLIKKGRNKNISIEIEGESIGQEIQSIENPFSILVTGLAGIPHEEKYQTPLVVKKSAARGDSNSVFRNILLLLKQNSEAWAHFQSEMQKIFPNYTIDVKFDKDKDEFISCTVEKDDGIQYPIDSCGTGILQVIQIISYIYLFNPQILLLDEPDSHLHPNNQRLLAQRLMELSEITNTKIVIATHSRYLIDELIDESNLLWLSNGKLQSCEDNHIINLLIGMGALDAGQRLSPPKWILLTEDSNLDFLETLIISNGAKLNEGEIKSYKGCTKIETAQVLLEYLRKSFPEARFIIHRDRDFLSDEKIDDYKSKFDDVYFLIPEFNDIESLFISIDHLKSACGVSQKNAEEIIQSAFNSNRLELIKKYVNVKKQNFPFKEQADKAGEFASEACMLFETYNPKYIHGKEMLKAIRRELSARGIADKLNDPDKLNEPTEDLKVENIAGLFSGL